MRGSESIGAGLWRRARADLEEVSRSRLDTLAGLLKRQRRLIRYVDYSRAERDCQALAAKLLALVPHEELREYRFAAIPRGGLIVLGMLSYHLDLVSQQFSASGSRERPLVVVDDCCLSGARFGSYLRGVNSSRVIFAHLYSHPDLRRAVCERESRVEHCVAALDLEDHAREQQGGEQSYKEWRRRWRDRLGEGRYWFGMPDQVCFAWSEPDRPFWNPVAGRVEESWRFLSPQDCLKNRTALGLPPIPAHHTSWRVPREVVFGEFDGVLWLCSPEEEIFALEGIGADMWKAMAAWGDPDAAVNYLARAYEADPRELDVDLEGFLAELKANNLLETCGP